jgi:glycosyltransferase involved in cell wall biosynthesis
MNKKVLIVCYSFPPYPGIGGRRWAKFAKYLYRNGYNVNVISSKNKADENSQWKTDIEEYSNNIDYIESNYPFYLGINPKTIYEKIRYRFSLQYCKWFTKGNYYDKSNFWKDNLIEKTKRIIENKNIKNIIVTCAPFKMSFYLLEIKSYFPDINMIADFRDPWTNNLTGYGLENMSQIRIRYEKSIEKKVINGYDKIVVVAEEMKNFFLNEYHVNCNKISVIANGFDNEDYKSLSIDNCSFFNHNDKLKIVFTGTFYDKSIYLLEELVEVIYKNQKIKKNFEFHFFGSFPKQCINLIKLVPDNIIFHGHVDLSKVYSVIAQSDYCSLFLTNDINYSLSTKFLEYLSQKKKILVFSNGGRTSSFIEENKLGFSINNKKMDDDLLKIIDLDQQIKTEIDSDFNIKEYSVFNLTKKVENLLNF